MAIGRKISLTPNVKSKKINVTATADQTLFTVTGGYRINNISVYRNGVLLAIGSDFLANDGSTVTLLSAATVGDVVQFEVFDTHEIADALNQNGDQILDGALTVTGIVSASSIKIGSAITFSDTGINVTGVITATSFTGDGSGLTGVANTDFVVSTATTTVRMVVTGGANVTGVVTAASFTGDGANLTNVGVDTATVDTGSLKVSGISTLTGYVSMGSTVGAAGSIYFPDRKGINFGNAAEGDLRIYHSGNHSHIQDSGTGELLLSGSIVSLNSGDASEYMLKATTDGTVELYHDGKERFETQDDGVEVIHAGTANTMRMHAGGSVGVGIGVTNTTGRDAAAGVGTVKGQIVFNETDGAMQVYGGTEWIGIASVAALETTGGVKIESGSDVYHVFNSDLGSTTFIVEGTAGLTGAKVLIVGGGAGSNNDNGAAGGAGGVVYGSNVPFSPGTYPARVGVGGTTNQNRDNDVECNGQPSRLSTPVGVVTGFGGQGSSNQNGNPYVLYKTWGSDWIMNPYGDNPDITPNTLFGSGCGGRITNPTSMEQSNIAFPTPYGQPSRPTFGGLFTNYGSSGGGATNSAYWNTGGGGGAAESGTASNPGASPRAEGGDGQPFPEFPAPVIAPGIPTPFRPDFESEVGPTGMFGGGGGGSMENPPFSGNGGAGGGGDGNNSANAPSPGLKGTFGTGGGSGSYGGGSPGSMVPAVGGAGIIIIKYTV